MEKNDIEYIFITELDTKSSGHRSWICADGMVSVNETEDMQL